MTNKIYETRRHAFLKLILYKIALVCIFCLNGNVVKSQSASTVLTNAGVIEMNKSGLGNEIILASIESSVCKFNVTSTALVTLKKSGVNDLVIKAMMDKQNARPAPASLVSTQNVAAKIDKKEVVAKKAESFSLLNHVYFFPAESEPKPLEKMVAGIRTKQGAFGGAVLFQVDGPKSTVRLSSESAAFAISTGSDALPELVLYKLKVVKGKREVATMKANTFSGMKTGEDVVTLNISKLDNGSYKIIPGKKLDAGEYFFTGKPSQGSASAEAFAFGID
jgi:hypothetical protein